MKDNELLEKYLKDNVCSTNKHIRCVENMVDVCFPDGTLSIMALGGVIHTQIDGYDYNKYILKGNDWVIYNGDPSLA